MMQVDFESVMKMTDERIIRVFQAIKDANLESFLGDALSVCEPEVKQFVKNAVIDDDTVVSTVNGVEIRINEELFAGMFNLPNEGPSSISDIPDEESEAMLAVFGKEQLAKRSGKKADLKTEYRLLNDIVHRGLLAKEGAFDAYTEERFTLMTVIMQGIQFNWGSYLFTYFAAKFSNPTKKGQGYIAQISHIILSTPELVCKGKPTNFPRRIVN